MKKVVQSGRYLFAISIVAFGIIQLVTGNFLSELFPVPASLPGRIFFVYFFSIGFVISGLCILINKLSRSATALTGLILFILILYPHLPSLISDLHNPGGWTFTFETIALCSGAFILAGTLQSDLSMRQRWGNIIGRLSKYSHIPFAIALIIFGIQHFMYAKYVITQIPSWIPAHLFWSYIIRFAFMATAISIILKIQVRLATTLLGAMFLLWVILVHIPGVITNPHSETVKSG